VRFVSLVETSTLLHRIAPLEVIFFMLLLLILIYLL
jgi:hypothetical protein